MSDRREALIDATLELLASLPPAQVSTRAIAAAVGLSQPAIFRHFATRDALLAAVADRARDELREAAASAPPACEGAIAHLRALSAAQARVLSAYPGLARLLFHELAEGHQRPSLGGVLAMQAGLMGEVLVLAIARGEVEAGVDAEAAAQLYVALLQGTVAMWLAAGRGPELHERLARALDLWLAGLGAVRGAAKRVASAPAGDQALVTLDVRDLLAGGVEPLPTIQAALRTVRPDGRLVLLAPFEPRPLRALLATRGWRSAPRQHGGSWEIELIGPEAVAVEDLTDLPAPEPMERTLLAVSALRAGELWWGRMPRVPRMLFPHLNQRGLAWATHPCLDGTALLAVWRIG